MSDTMLLLFALGLRWYVVVNAWLQWLLMKFVILQMIILNL